MTKLAWIFANRARWAIGVAIALQFVIGTAALNAQDAIYDQVPPDDAVFLRAFIGQDAVQGVAGLPANVISEIVANGVAYSSLSAAEFSLSNPGSYHAVLTDGDGTVHLVQ